jgi:putative addiction module component (TIGR02574 family)
MTPTLQAVEAAAMRLSDTDRAELIERLIDTVVPPPPLHPDWEAELARRAADLDSGRDTAIPMEQVMAQVRAMIEAAVPSKPKP